MHDIVDRDVQLKDTIGNVHTVWVKNHSNITGMLSTRVLDFVNFYRLTTSHRIKFVYHGLRKMSIHIFYDCNAEIPYPNLCCPKVVPLVGWIVIASKAFSSGKSPLYVPSSISRKILKRNQSKLGLISMIGTPLLGKILKRRKSSTHGRYVGGACYKFCKNLNFSKGSVVKFHFDYDKPDKLYVTVI